MFPAPLAQSQFSPAWPIQLKKPRQNLFQAGQEPFYEKTEYLDRLKSSDSAQAL